MQAKKLTDFIKVYDDMITPELCKEIMELYESNSDHHDRIDRDYRPNFTQFNLTQFVNSGASTAQSKLIHDNITKTLLSAVNLYMIDMSITNELPSQYALEEVRIKKYDANRTDQFADHVDVGDHNSARRFLAFFLYLTENEFEGQTNFTYLDLSIDPKPGRILVFPPLWLFPHAGMPVSKSEKYIVGSYCHYL
jgi:hypothetical protein